MASVESLSRRAHVRCPDPLGDHHRAFAPDPGSAAAGPTIGNPADAVLGIRHIDTPCTPYGCGKPIRQASLVKLTTDQGVEGIGEAWGPPRITKAYLELIAPYFVGREVYGFEHATSACPRTIISVFRIR
jgi:hypothetical protein